MRAYVWHAGDSFLHRLNPLTKLALNPPVVVVVSLAYEPVTPLAIALLAILATLRLGRVPWPAVRRPLGVAALLGSGMFWTSALFYAGPGAGPGAPAVGLGPLRVTEAGLIYGLAMAARLLAVFAASLLFVLTTDPTRFVLALIQQGRLPYRVGYAVFVAQRFVPLLLQELDHIRAAHQVRGGPSGRHPIARARQFFAYAIPLLAIAVRRAERVALAMESRAFGALPRRTYFRTTTLGRDDVLFAAGAGAALAAVVLGRPAFG